MTFPEVSGASRDRHGSAGEKHCRGARAPV